jgi:predicted ester cyclase
MWRRRDGRPEASTVVAADSRRHGRLPVFPGKRSRRLPDLKVSVQASLADANKVAASFLYEGARHCPPYGVAPTEKRQLLDCIRLRQSCTLYV